MRFRAEQHLRRTADFQLTRSEGRRYDCGAFTLWFRPRVAPAAAVVSPPSDTAPASAAESTLRATMAPGKTPAADASRREAAAPAADVRRLGVVASRAAVGNAVQRARTKRRLREVFRAHQLEVPPGCDVVAVARRGLLDLPHTEACERFVRSCARFAAWQASS